MEVCTVSNHISSATVALFVCRTTPCGFLKGARNAISFPDFLLINPGEWQGWHSLIPRLREAPGILTPSKHCELPMAAVSLVADPGAQLSAYEIPNLPIHSTLMRTRRSYSLCFIQLMDKSQWIGLSLFSRSLENYHSSACCAASRWPSFQTYGQQ